MDDPYTTLGVARDASQDDIRNAYRKLAKLHHPDLNPGKPEAEVRFKTVTAANELLSDPEKRGRFDRGEIDAEGHEPPPRPSYRDFADGEAGHRYGGSDDFADMFGSMFEESGRRGGGRRAGRDERYALTVGFLEAVNGATRRLTLPDGRTLDVTIPVGTEDGQVLRLRGQGGQGREGASNGDALIEVHVTPHPWFVRDGRDIRLDLPATLAEVVLGGSIEMPTPGGPVRMRIPAQSDNGTKLRLRGRGVPAHGGHAAGDLHATLRLQVGAPDPALEAFLRDWKPDPASNPRRAMEATP